MWNVGVKLRNPAKRGRWKRRGGQTRNVKKGSATLLQKQNHGAERNSQKRKKILEKTEREESGGDSSPLAFTRWRRSRSTNQEKEMRLKWDHR